MFWNKLTNKEIKEPNTEPSEKLNYTVFGNGDIQILTLGECLYWYATIKKENLIKLSNTEIKCIAYKNCANFECKDQLIENKQDLIEWKETITETYRYHAKEWSNDRPRWHKIFCETIEKYDEETTAVQEIFKTKFDSKYKLIESEEELNNYLQSKLSCDDWCRLKLVTKMKELNLGSGFITAFADLIGNDRDKYYTMIDLASEVKDLDILMYLLVHKFGKKEN